jgi:hypothetical protein
VEECDHTGLSAGYETGGCLDCRSLSRQDQHAPGAPAKPLAREPIIRLILDGTVVRVRLNKKATSISLLVALGVRQDGQKVLLAVKNMGSESEAA